MYPHTKQEIKDVVVPLVCIGAVGWLAWAGLDLEPADESGRTRPDNTLTADITVDTDVSSEAHERDVALARLRAQAIDTTHRILNALDDPRNGAEADSTGLFIGNPAVDGPEFRAFFDPEDNLIVFSAEQSTGIDEGSFDGYEILMHVTSDNHIVRTATERPLELDDFRIALMSPSTLSLESLSVRSDWGSQPETQSTVGTYLEITARQDGSVQGAYTLNGLNQLSNNYYTNLATSDQLNLVADIYTNLSAIVPIFNQN